MSMTEEKPAVMETKQTPVILDGESLTIDQTVEKLEAEGRWLAEHL